MPANRDRLIRDVAPEGDPPKISEAVIKALDSDRTFLIAPRWMTENSPKGHPLRPVLERALGAGGMSKCKAPIVSIMKHTRFRKGDKLVICVPCPDAPYSHKHATLVGPIEADRHWDAAADLGAGAVSTSTFFRAIAEAASPLTPKRREENGTFEMMLA